MNPRLLFPLVPAMFLAATGCSDGWKPEGRIQSEITQLIRYDSCSALEQDLKRTLTHEVWANIERSEWGRNGGGGDSADAGGEPPAAEGGRQEGIDYSGTNNQEDGVDEADHVKTDGYHLYAINGNRLHIFGVPTFGSLIPESTTQIEGHPTEMLLHKDAGRVVVFSTIDSRELPENHPLYTRVGKKDKQDDQFWYWRVKQISKVTVLDITNRAAPVTNREFYFEGDYQTARRIDTSVRIGSYASIDIPELYNWWQVSDQQGPARAKEIMAARINALSLADLIPQIYARTAGGELETQSLSQESCRSFSRPSDSHARGIASIMSFDLMNQALVWDADHVISNWGTFYASKDTWIIAETAHDWWWYWWWQDDADQLNIHAFDISAAGTTAYLGSGRVKGQIVNQFALDEEKGAIRVATTVNPFWRWWLEGADQEREPSTNHVWVLERKADSGLLATVGHVGGIAPGERIMSARFLGDRGFLVTFRNIDPLFTIDLKDNAHPKLVGELKVPGFSTYLHPIEGDKLLSIGVGGDNGGANWRTTISLFDVSNFAMPTLAQSLPIAAENGWGWSEALYQHKAFTYFAPKKMLAVPQSNYSYQLSAGQTVYSYLAKLELIEVDPATNSVQRKGAIDHSAYYSTDPSHYWSNVDIRRSIFMGDFIYAISDKAITVHRLSDLSLIADEELPGFDYSDWWWGGWFGE